jgi:helix-turn-helix protein
MSIPIMEDIEHEVMINDALERVKSMSKIDRMVLCRPYEGISKAKLAKMLGVSYSRLDSIENRAIFRVGKLGYDRREIERIRYVGTREGVFSMPSEKAKERYKTNGK